jgi:hypothetical protein
VGEVGLDRAQEVGAVLAVVGHERLDRIVVEAPHLVGIGGQGAEQQAVDAVADPLLELFGHAPVGGDDLQHQLRLSIARPGSSGLAQKGRQPARAVGVGPSRSAPRPGALGRVVASARRQDRVIPLR